MTRRTGRVAAGIHGERGVALMAVLAITLALLPLAAAVVLEARVDLLMQQNARGAAEAFYAAEAGLAHALAELGPRTSYDSLLRGEDGIAGTSDDGAFPFARASPATFAQPPVRYEVSVAAGPAERLRLHSWGYGRFDATREVELLVAPSTTPFTPAAYYVESESADVDLGRDGFAISGTPPTTSHTRPVTGIGVIGEAAAAALRATIEPAALVTGLGGAPSVLATIRIEIPSYLTEIERRDDVVIQPSGELPGSLILGTEEMPQLSEVRGAWRIRGTVQGSGVLIVRGSLEVSGQLEYLGLLVVDGTIDFRLASDVRIEGALWSTGGANLQGTGRISYVPDVLRRVEDAIPASLLHMPEITGWREVS